MICGKCASALYSVTSTLSKQAPVFSRQARFITRRLTIYRSLTTTPTSTNAIKATDQPEPESATDSTPATPQSTHEPSSVAAGTPLKGLAFLANADPPLAKPDEDYPAWLWTLIDNPKRGLKSTKTPNATSSTGTGTVSKDGSGGKGKKGRGKTRLSSGSSADTLDTVGTEASRGTAIPMHEQSVDLPAGMHATEAKAAREAQELLRMNLRQARRKGIRENNFLKSMR